MPKKHQPTYLSIKPSSTASSSRAPATPPPAAAQSVNERIQQLRREQAPRASAQRRDEVTEVVSRRTVPPHLRRLLHMAEVDAPPPKPGTRARAAPLRPGQRPPPGPAPPSSWLQGSQHASQRNVRRKTSGVGRARMCMLARVHDEEFKRLPPARSLVHQCLRAFALHWEELIEYEQHYLPALPMALKESLLSYLALYGHHGCLDFKSLKILFRSDGETEGGSGSAEVRFLDFTGLLNERYTLQDLEKSLQRSGSMAAVASSIDGLSIATPAQAEKASADVVESWEDAAEEATMPVTPAALNVPIFPNLTRLSLGHPGAAASWNDLLNLSVYLNTLTHLSLAYWPRPSTTPNAATTSMVSRHATVSLGGSNFYSDLDDDWHEAANILRRFSLNTYCLKWLDLEGCTWLKALTWEAVSSSPPTFPNTQPTLAEWTRPASSPGPNWNAAWRQIEYINLFQGWIPADRQSLQNMPAGVVPAQVMRWLRENEDKDEVKQVLGRETGYAVHEWIEREKVARSVAMEIQGLRKAHGGKWCVVDHGWGK